MFSCPILEQSGGSVYLELESARFINNLLNRLIKLHEGGAHEIIVDRYRNFIIDWCNKSQWSNFSANP